MGVLPLILPRVSLNSSLVITSSIRVLALLSFFCQNICLSSLYRFCVVFLPWTPPPGLVCLLASLLPFHLSESGAQYRVSDTINSCTFPENHYYLLFCLPFCYCWFCKK